MPTGEALFLKAGDKLIGKRLELVPGEFSWCGQNPDLGVPTPRPPVERRDAAPQTPLRMDGWCASLDSHSLHLRF
jgi:hypothetical protein